MNLESEGESVGSLAMAAILLLMILVTLWLTRKRPEP